MKCIVANITSAINSSPSFELSNISFSLGEGEILAIVGESGAGKSSLLNTLAGFLPIQHGAIILDDETVSCASYSLSPIERNVGYIFQDENLLPHLSLFDNLTLGMSSQEIEERQKEIRELMEFLHLDHLKHQYPKQVSGGQQQRVALGRALLHHKKLLLFDEPFSGLDRTRMSTLALTIKKSVKEFKRIAVVVTHHIEEAFLIADKIAIMNHGKLLQIDTPKHIFEKPNNTYIAQFLGDTNFIEGTITGERTVQTAFGKITRSNSNKKLPINTIVTVLTRHDDYEIDSTKDDFIVTNVQFNGIHQVITAQKDNLTLSLIVDHDYILPPDKKVGVSLKKTHPYYCYSLS